MDRIRAVAPGAADWHVHHEARGVADAVTAEGYAAVVGHADPTVADGAIAAYEEARLACLLPFVRGRPPAASWAADDSRLARTLAEGAVALGASLLHVVAATAGPPSPGTAGDSDSLAERVADAARAVGLAVEVRDADILATDADILVPDADILMSGAVRTAAHRPRTPERGHGTGATATATALALLAPQERLPPLLRALPGADRYEAVLVPAECGLPSFPALAGAARGLPVWAVHPELCLVRRARVALTALATALAEDPALRGPRLTADVVTRSAHLLGPAGGVLGEGTRVSRLPAMCPGC
ncbi:hypothetical protein GCM10010383_01530 [Streptomyces lomondensis]|uniref:Amidohydrolase n=1 Tax=Streptomyces lomondensis TaxID=68229 RepID=A0ABQ2WTX5_9ACTN|nr:hypothetical protein GCM10010383_01530 [Streptomyces lomondensis]